jgi:DNA-binding transcriptional LysR family regulator
MELMQLEMFVAVVEERSFCGAAERVFRTQPAVSLALRKLERRIGAPLLDRSSRRRTRLTPTGELLYEYATRILALRDEALSSLKQEGCTSTGNLRVGVTSDGNFEWIPQITRTFNEQYPNARLEILYDRATRFFPELTARRLEIVLLSGRPKSDTENRGFVVTRVRGDRTSGALWIVRRRLGQSALAHAFEQSVTRHFARPVSAPNHPKNELGGSSSATLSVAKHAVGSANARC